MSAPTVLIPRAGSWGRELAADLRARGANPLVAPLIDTLPVEDPTALEAAFEQLRRGGFEWLTVTSQATVRVMTRWNARIPAGTAIAAVGPATAQALHGAGYRVHLLPDDDHSARGLLHAWPAEAAGTRVLALGSDQAHPTLVDGLRAVGCDVTAVTAYRTVGVDAPDAVAAAVRAGDVSTILLTSGSVAHEVARQFGPVPPEIRLIAVGEQTAQDARSAGLQVGIVTAHRSASALAAAALMAEDQPAPAPRTTVSADVPAPGVPTPAPSDPDRPAQAEPKASATPAAPAGPVVRPRRLRASEAMRRLVAETRIHPAQLILPLFVREGLSEPVPIEAMPGVVQHSMDSLRRASVQAAAAGLGGVMLFGVPRHRDASGTAATDPDGILNRATRAVAAEVGDALVVQTDLCLDEFTDHGHCGVLDECGRVDNDATLRRYGDMALAQAEAGSQLLGLSGMMDGQVAAVRGALDRAGHTGTAILGYAAKYASAFYGPFREAVDSQLNGDRRTYQQDPANRREGAREAALDIAEGADIIMVKPAMAYLDVLSDVAAASSIPVWAYQVSGEYAMICAAGERGWIDRDRALAESVTGILRAGAQAVLTYAAIELSAAR